MGYKYNKEDILNVGFDVFRRNGYHNVGINQILKESGIPKGSFYNFFESKEDFAQQVIHHYGVSNCQWIDDFFANTPGNALQKIEAFYDTLIDMNDKDDYRGGCLINNMNMEVGHNIKILGDEANKHFLTWVKVISEIIDDGQSKRVITKGYKSDVIAEYLHSGFYGVLSRSKVTKQKDEMKKWLKMSLAFLEA